MLDQLYKIRADALRENETHNTQLNHAQPCEAFLFLDMQKNKAVARMFLRSPHPPQESQP